MITQEDIARMVGVSQGVISAVLNDSNAIRVSKDTREQILRLVDETGYQPNRLAKALRTGKSGVIGILFRGGYSQIWMAKLFEVVKEVKARGYRPLIYDMVLMSDSEESASVWLLRERVEGVMLLGVSGLVTDPRLSRAVLGKVPVVSMDGFLDVPIPQVQSDREQGFYILAKHLLELGHQRLGILRLEKWANYEHPHTEGMLKGVSRALAEFGKSEPIMIRLPRVDRDIEDPYIDGKAHMQELLKRKREDWPDAVICSNDAWAIGAISACAEQGIRVPEDIAVVGFQDEVQAAYVVPPLTTVAPPLKTLAARGVERLVELIGQGRPVPEEQEILNMPCSLVVRESCGVKLKQNKGK